MLRFKIQSGVPLAPKSHETPQGYKYPFVAMKVGDSFFVHTDGKAYRSPLYKHISNAAHAHGKHHNAKFAVRSVRGGFRLWRTK